MLDVIDQNYQHVSSVNSVNLIKYLEDVCADN